MPLRVASLCGQSGAAAALAPVLLAAAAEAAWEVRALAYGESGTVFTAHGLAIDRCDASFNFADATRWLTGRLPDVVLLGSDGVRNAEKETLRAARQLQIPSVTFVDFWSSYAARFEDARGRALPDAIAVLDRRMAREVAALGIPSSLLHITGSPALERALEMGKAIGGPREALRRSLGLPEAGRCVLFVSSPSSALDCGELPALSGRPHSLRATVQGLAAALDGLAASDDGATSLVIKPHPRESPSSFLGLQGDRLQIVVSARDVPPPDLLSVCDLVIGLDSMLLLEALLARRAAIALDFVRPLVPAVRDLMQRCGVLAGCRESLAGALHRALAGPVPAAAPDPMLRDMAVGATGRMLELISATAMEREA
jgi:hypothetical protein